MLRYAYLNKIKCVLRLTQIYVIIVIRLLANSLGLKRLSSGQYLQKKLKMLKHSVEKRKFFGIPFKLISGP